MIDSIVSLRALACMCVILIHVSATVVTVGDELSIHWWLANILQSIIFWPVPIFIMISGYLILPPKDEKIITFLRHRVTKIIIPSLIWVTLYLIWGYYIRDLPKNSDDVIKSLLSGNVSDHLYFLFVLCGLYLLSPLLRIILSGKDGKTILAFGILLSLFSMFDHTINRHLGQWGGNAANLPITYLGFFISGYGFRLVLDDGCLTTNKHKLLISTFIFCIAIYILFKYIEAAGTNEGIPYYYANSYFSFPLTIIAYCLFPLLLKSSLMSRIGKRKPILLIGEASFGIYLIHIIFIDIAFKVFKWQEPVTLIAIIGFFIIFFGVSLVSTVILQKNSTLNFLVGGPNKATQTEPEFDPTTRDR